MRIRALAIAVVAAVIAFGSIASVGFATVGFATALDESSAATYIHDATAYVNGVLHSEPAIRRAADRFVTVVRSGCPKLLPATGTNTSAVVLALKFEAQYELILLQLRPIQARAVAFSASVARLRWDDARIRGATAYEAREEAGLARIHRLPNLCDDIHTSAAGGFATIPQDTTRFLSQLGRDVVVGKSQPSQAQFLSSLKPYTTQADAGALTTLQRLGRTEQRSINGIFNAASAELETVLGAAPYP